MTNWNYVWLWCGLVYDQIWVLFKLLKCKVFAIGATERIGIVLGLFVRTGLGHYFVYCH